METAYGSGTLYCAECGRPTAPDELARFGDLLICPYCKDNYAHKLREGVVSRAAFQYGGFWIRFLAVIIDSIILMVAGSILQFAFLGKFLQRLTPPTPGTPPQEFVAAMLGVMGASMAINFLVDGAYQTLFIGLIGATPGKLALGLKVVRPDGSPVGLGRAAGRFLGKLLSYMILAIGYIIAAFDSEKRALHDMICDTRVIRARDI